LTLFYFKLLYCSRRQTRRRGVRGDREASHDPAASGSEGPHPRRDTGLESTETQKSTETKSAYKTTELIVYVVAVLGVLIASALVTDASFGADHAWRYVTYLTVGYMISRGLAKAGSREPYRD
jgi:hypothetical protein